MSPLWRIPRKVGLKSGDRGPEVSKLQKYLQNFGYIQSDKIEYFGVKINRAKAAKKPIMGKFDDNTRRGLELFQEFNKLPVTGILDKRVISLMLKARCAAPDIVEGGDVATYTTHPNKWPNTSLTYLFQNYTPDLSQNITRRAVQDAIAQWTSVTPLTFTEATSGSNIRFTWARGNHGDGYPFDGPGGVLAHAFYPTDGRCHFDEDERWTDDNPPSGYDLVTVALHELGHILGLRHSTDVNAVMYAYYFGRRRELQSDDIAGIQSIYGGPIFRKVVAVRCRRGGPIYARRVTIGRPVLCPRGGPAAARG